MTGTGNGDSTKRLGARWQGASMARSQQGIEIYVRDCSLDRIQDWIQTVLGAITPVDQVNEMSKRIHEAYHA
jgi:hypothetical protein